MTKNNSTKKPSNQKKAKNIPTKAKKAPIGYSKISDYSINVMIIAGPSGQGKSRLEQMLIANKGRFVMDIENEQRQGILNVRKIIQCTTRERRKNESVNPLQSYKFINTNQYKSLDDDGLLFGKTSIEYENGKTDYYGSIIPLQDIVNAYFRERFLGEKTIFTIILNAKGIDDFFEYVQSGCCVHNDEFELENINVNIMLTKVDGNNTLLRKGRDEAYVESERQDLSKFDDMVGFSYYNDFETHDFINDETVLNLAKDVYELITDKKVL